MNAELYPPTPWKCPGCNKTHSKAHYAFEGQVDTSKPIREEGRVKFNREGSEMRCDDFKHDTPEIDQTGPAVVDGLEQPLFCPHCGWLAEIFHFKVIKPKGVGVVMCCIKGCERKAANPNDEYPMCWSHGKIIREGS